MLVGFPFSNFSIISAALRANECLVPGSGQAEAGCPFVLEVAECRPCCLRNGLSRQPQLTWLDSSEPWDDSSKDEASQEQGAQRTTMACMYWPHP